MPRLTLGRGVRGGQRGCWAGGCCLRVWRRRPSIFRYIHTVCISSPWSIKKSQQFLPIGTKITPGSQADAEGCHVYSFSAFLYTYIFNIYKRPNSYPWGKADGLLTRCFTYIAQVPHLMLIYTPCHIKILQYVKKNRLSTLKNTTKLTKLRS